MNNQQIFTELVAALQEDGRAALATVIATHGSTPQKAAAKLLIKADGQHSRGTLGGGCVEAAVWQEAVRALANGQPRFAAYELSDDYAGDNGMVCGGTMEVLVDVWTAADLPLAEGVAAKLAAGQPCMLLTLLADAQLGGKALLSGGRGEHWQVGNIAAELGATMREGLHDGGALGLRDYAVLDLAGQLVFAENLRGQAELIIVGAGHIAQALAYIAAFVGFAVTVVDNRESFANPERFPNAQVFADDYATVLPQLTIGPQTYIVIVTRGHQFDEGALRMVLDTSAAYIGMIGSRRKVLLVYKRMLADGYDPAKLRRIYAPLGLAIGAETVEEIAVSIVAELIKVRRRGSEGEAAHLRAGVEQHIAAQQPR